MTYVKRSSVEKTLAKLCEHVPDEYAIAFVQTAGLEVTPERLQAAKTELQSIFANALRMMEPV